MTKDELNNIFCTMRIEIKNLIEDDRIKILQKITDPSFLDDKDLISLEIDIDVFYVPENVVLAKGILKGILNKKCSRCLEIFEYKIDVPFEREYCISHTQEVLDISQDIKEEFLLALPLIFLCNLDCKGLCQICGKNMNKFKCKCKSDKHVHIHNTNAFDVLKKIKNKR
ncbi:DUF177 domain-containing protein [bacterium]